MGFKWKFIKFRCEKFVSFRSLIWRFYRNDFCFLRALFEVLFSLLILNEIKELDKMEGVRFGNRRFSFKKEFYFNIDIICF